MTYSNGLVWRRLTYSTLMADTPDGYSWQPIDFFAMAPSGTTWGDLFERDVTFADYHVASAVDAYSDRHYDVYWADGREPRRNGEKRVLLDISRSRGFAMVMPFKAGCLFTIMGPASGFPAEKSRIVDHLSPIPAGGDGGRDAGTTCPSGGSTPRSTSTNPALLTRYHFGPFSHYIVNRPLEKWLTLLLSFVAC